MNLQMQELCLQGSRRAFKNVVNTYHDIMKFEDFEIFTLVSTFPFAAIIPLLYVLHELHAITSKHKALHSTHVPVKRARKETETKRARDDRLVYAGKIINGFAAPRAFQELTL